MHGSMVHVFLPWQSIGTEQSLDVQESCEGNALPKTSTTEGQIKWMTPDQISELRRVLLNHIEESILAKSQKGR